MKRTLATALLFFSTSCTHRYPVATLPIVSMTESIPAKMPLPKSTSDVKAKYCIGEPPIATDSSDIGYIDEVTLRAQKKSKARFIKNANYTMEVKLFSGSCILLEGEAWK